MRLHIIQDWRSVEINARAESVADVDFLIKVLVKYREIVGLMEERNRLRSTLPSRVPDLDAAE